MSHIIREVIFKTFNDEKEVNRILDHRRNRYVWNVLSILSLECDINIYDESIKDFVEVTNERFLIDIQSTTVITGPFVSLNILFA